MKEMLLGLWRYRYFVLGSIRNEFVSRFVRSKLGGLWMIINPLALVAIYALVLSSVLAARLPGIENQYGYAVYLMAGLLGWTLFSEIVTRCLNLFIENGNLMQKMRFPRIALPVIVVGSALVNNALLLMAMLVVFLFLGHGYSAAMVWLVPLTGILVLLGLGAGLLLGVINVFVRDVGQVVPIVLQLGFWLTPIVYPIGIIPESYRHWFELNLLYPVIDGYHAVLLYGVAPDISGLIPITLVSVGLLLTSVFVFSRASAEIVDSL